MQEDISRIDKEARKLASESAEARQTFDKYREIVSPYEHLFRAEGVEPLQGINNLMRTTAMLATGPQQTKAQIVAGIIKTYGVDIATLDALLAGQPASPQQYQQPAYQPPDPRQFRDPRLDALLQQQTHKVQQEAAEQLSEIENEDFYDDLRDNMAKLLEAGLVKTAREAYDRAALFHPEVAKVMEQRRAAASQGSTQRAQAAASSIKPQPAVGVAATSDRGWAGAVEDAWEKLNGR
jgi:DNA-binding TFAR19-related protein (PDSD5 family)